MLHAVKIIALGKFQPAQLFSAEALSGTGALQAFIAGSPII